MIHNKLLLITFLFCGNCVTISAQDINKKVAVGIGLLYELTGNGFGSNTSPVVEVNYGRKSFSIGPNIQSNLNISGYNCTYQYILSSLTGKNINMLAFGTFIYNSDAYLSKHSTYMEYSSGKDNYIEYKKIKLSTVELYSGLGLIKKLQKHFSVLSSIGVGMYHTISDYEFCKNMMRENSSPSLIIKCGITYKF